MVSPKVSLPTVGFPCKPIMRFAWRHSFSRMPPIMKTSPAQFSVLEKYISTPLHTNLKCANKWLCRFTDLPFDKDGAERVQFFMEFLACIQYLKAEYKISDRTKIKRAESGRIRFLHVFYMDIVLWRLQFLRKRKGFFGG